MPVALPCKTFKFSGHAVQRIFENRLNENDVLTAIGEARVIARYPDDKPLPSLLLLGYCGARAIHVVLGIDATGGNCVVVTTYLPDPLIWEDDFTRRRMN